MCVPTVFRLTSGVRRNTHQLFVLPARRHDDRSVVLATDGLWDVMQPDDVIETVKRVLDAGGNSALKAEALGDAATSLASTAAQVRLPGRVEDGWVFLSFVG